MKQKITIILLICLLKLSAQNPIHKIELFTFDQQWDATLDKYKMAGSRERLMCTAIIDGIRYDSTGFRFKGNSSYSPSYRKNPMNIKPGCFKKDGGNRTIKLSNIFRDPSGIREKLGYEIADQYMVAPECSYTELYINDTLIGLYTMPESVDKSFVRENLHMKNGSLFKCDPLKHGPPPGCIETMYAALVLGFSSDSLCYRNAYEIKSNDGWGKLFRLLQAIWYNSDPNSVYYSKLEEHLNIDQTLCMLAFNNLFVNLDSYNYSGHNFYIAEDASGRFNPIVWDLNMCFGGFRIGCDFDKLSSFPLFYGIDNKLTPLISRVLTHDPYRKMYLAHYRTMYDDQILSGKFERRARELQSEISTFIKRDPWFYYSDSDFDHSLDSNYMNDIPGLLKLMNERKAFLQSLPEINYSFEKPVNHYVNQVSDDSLMVFLQLTCEREVTLYYRFDENELYTSKKLRSAADNNIYSIKIEGLKKPNLEYYFWIEDSLAGFFYPESASFCPHRYNMKQR